MINRLLSCVGQPPVPLRQNACVRAVGSFSCLGVGVFVCLCVLRACLCYVPVCACACLCLCACVSLHGSLPSFVGLPVCLLVACWSACAECAGVSVHLFDYVLSVSLFLSFVPRARVCLCICALIRLTVSVSVRLYPSLWAIK